MSALTCLPAARAITIYRPNYIAKVSAIFIQRYGKTCFEETLKKAMDDGVAYPKGFNQTGSLRAAMELMEHYRMQDDLF